MTTSKFYLSGTDILKHGLKIGYVMDTKEGERIIDCVNAFTGIENPKDWPVAEIAVKHGQLLRDVHMLETIKLELSNKIEVNSVLREHLESNKIMIHRARRQLISSIFILLVAAVLFLSTLITN
jgi:hypothetical protein